MHLDLTNSKITVSEAKFNIHIACSYYYYLFHYVPIIGVKAIRVIGNSLLLLRKPVLL